MTWNKREIIRQAFTEIGMFPHTYEISADEYQDALRVLDAMMAEWIGRGVVFDPAYPIPEGYGEGSLDEATNAPAEALAAIYCSLAVRLAPSYGKQVSPETKRNAKRGYDLIAQNVAVPEIIMKGMVRGQGQKLPFHPFIQGSDTYSGSSGSGGGGDDIVGLPPGGEAGQILAKKSDKDFDFGFVDAPNTPVIAMKASDTVRTNTNIRTPDPDLYVDVEANSRYVVEVIAYYTSTTSADFRSNFAFPTGASLKMVRDFSTAAVVREGTFATNSAGQGLNDVRAFQTMGSLVVGGTPGTFSLDWAQNIAEATDTTLQSGSFIRLQKVG